MLASRASYNKNTLAQQVIPLAPGYQTALLSRPGVYSKQFGFRSHHSADHAVLSIIDNEQKAIEDREFSCGVFLDFSEAFDTVNHEIPLTKLEFYGIRSIVKD